MTVCLRQILSTTRLNETEAARRLADDLLDRAKDDDSFDALAALDAHPELLSFKSIVVDFAYEEYCSRVDAGEEIDPQVFAKRFPRYQQSVVHQLAVDEMIHRLDPRPEDWPCVVGESFMDFQLEEELGRGAFSRVFRAKQPRLGNREVVVKFCLGGELEAGFLGKLDHPGIVPVFSLDVDEDTQLAAICMPFLGRRTLFDVVDAVFGTNRAFESNEAVPAASDTSSEDADLSVYADDILEVGIQLATALSHTHASGIRHSDIKPSNVLVTDDGRAQLFDFNMSQSGDEQLNVEGGTLAYMSPEQLDSLLGKFGAGQVGIDHRTDVFSLGATLYHAITGRLPFGMPNADTQSQKDRAQVLRERQRHGVTPVRRYNSDVPEQIATIIEQCLIVDRDVRISSADELLDLFEQYQTSVRREAESRQRQKAAVPTMKRRIARYAATGLTLAVGAVAVITPDDQDTNPLEIKAAVEPEDAYRNPLDVALVALKQRDHSLAIDTLQTMLASDPEDPNAAFGLGYAFLEMGQYAKAVHYFELANKRSDEGRLLASLAYAKVLAAEDAESLQLGQGQDGMNPEEAREAARQRAVAKQAVYGEAIKLNEQAARAMGAPTPEIRTNIAYCLFRKRNGATLPQLEVQFKQLIEQNPGLQAAYANLAVQFAHPQGDFESMANYVLEAIDNGPEMPGLHLLAFKALQQLAGPEPTTGEQIAHATTAMDHLQQAIQQGYVGPRMEDVLFFESLKEHPDFAQRFEHLALLRVGPIIPLPKRNPCLANPATLEHKLELSVAAID